MTTEPIEPRDSSRRHEPDDEGATASQGPPAPGGTPVPSGAPASGDSPGSPEAPVPAGVDVDAAFEDIVARWDEPPLDPRHGRSAVRSPAGHVIPPVPAEGHEQAHFGWRSYAPAEEPEERYEPPRPRLPDAEGDPQFWTIVGLLGGGALVLLVLLLTGQTSRLYVGLAVGAMIAGFVLLVVRSGREPRDPDDDGARV